MSIKAGEDLLELRDEFKTWRSLNKKRTLIPESLWKKAEAMVGKYPINKVAYTLKLNLRVLKKRLDCDKASLPSNLQKHPELIRVAPIQIEKKQESKLKITTQSGIQLEYEGSGAEEAISQFFILLKEVM